MNFHSYKESLISNLPPQDASIYLKALWFDAKGDWDRSHKLIQEVDDLPAGRLDKKAAWIHAYLHRKEGDVTNADYWYRQAGKIRPSVSLENEWEEIVTALI